MIVKMMDAGGSGEEWSTVGNACRRSGTNLNAKGVQGEDPGMMQSMVFRYYG